MLLPRSPGAACARAAGWILLAVLSGGAALAQRVMVPHTSPRGLIALVDVSAGAMIQSDWIDVAATAQPPLTTASLLSHVERVDDEVWVAAGQWIYRYGVPSRSLIGSFPVGLPARSIDRQENRVLVTTRANIQSFSFDGSQLAVFDIQDAGDTMDMGDGTMLVALQDGTRVGRYTLAGDFIGVFAGPSVPTPFGILSRPGQLARRRNGNVLICGDVRVYEFTPAGDFVREVDAGPFEGGVIETFGGRWLVPLSTGLALHDPEFRTTNTVGGPFFGQGRKVGIFDRGDASVLNPGDPNTTVTCLGAPNATGFAARIGALGSPVVKERLFGLFGDRLPPGAMTAIAISREPAAIPFTGGTICVSRFSLAFPGGPQIADPTGRIQLVIVRGPIRLTSVAPGLTLHAQVFYRQGASVMVSDAISVTFAQ